MKTAQIISALSVSFFFGHSVFAAPVENPVLEQNARDAQVLNSEFSNLTATDECQPGSVACIGDTIAFCTTDKRFVASQTCLRSQNCFALPSVTGAGTNVACTSEATALSIFAACGADGTNLAEQAAADQRNNGTDSGFDNGNNNATSTTVSGDATVTVAQVVTVSVQSNGQPTTLGAVTQTIAPSDASGLFSTSTSTTATATTTSDANSTTTATTSDTTSTTATASNTNSVQTITVTSTSLSTTSSATETTSTTTNSTTDTAATSTTNASPAPAVTTPAAVVGGDNAIGSISTTSVSRVN